MISIRKYLYGPGGKRVAEAQEEAPGLEALYDLSCRLLDDLPQFVLTGDASIEMRDQLVEVKDILRPEITAKEASDLADSVSRILAGHHALTHQNALTAAVEMQHLLGMLNQALMVLASGSERSVSRLRKVQDSLQRASAMEDILALKASLADTIRFVEAESGKEQEATSRQLKEFEVEVGKSKEVLSVNRVVLPGRPEGVEAILKGVNAATPNRIFYVVAFVFERVHAIVQRYGPNVADELMLLLIQDRVRPVTPVHADFRWSFGSLVSVFQRAPGLLELQSEMSVLNQSPLVHRTFLGNRTAVLRASPSHLVAASVNNSAENLIAEIDRFTGVHP